MKAFLSYSSKDRHLVNGVANRLGRQFCLYDQFVFETGEDFATAMKRCLDDAAVFVLFASKHSLNSLWVKLEVNEAYQRKLRETIKRALVYIIDDKVQLDALPEWIRRALVRSYISSNAIARDIRAHLDELLRQRRQVYFIGRGIDTNRFEEMLTPMTGSTPPRVFVVSGLPGIGRRTLLKQVASNLLGLKKSIELRLEEGDSINDICAKIANITETFSSSEEFNKTFRQIQELSSRLRKKALSLV